MLLCSLMCRVRCQDVLLCYDMSEASDVQCPILRSIRWLCRLVLGNATLAELPVSQLHQLQSVLNATTRLIHRSSRYEHVTPMLRDLHWLRSPECINFKLAVLIYRCLLCLVSRYLSDSDYIQRVADSNCCCLRLSSSSKLVIRRTQLSTTGDRAFPLTGSRL